MTQRSLSPNDALGRVILMALAVDSQLSRWRQPGSVVAYAVKDPRIADAIRELRSGDVMEPRLDWCVGGRR